ncbi:MAG: hypothetical protein U0931_31550 [Vulcanimicrobiota bacterium]
MQGFRAALVITGFLTLALGSNLAWHYSRPVPLARQGIPAELNEESAVLESIGLRCRPNADWSDLLVESSQLDRARSAFQGRNLTPGQRGKVTKMATPPELLANLGRLPGVKEANIWIREDHEAVVALAMGHGAFAGDPRLLGEVVDSVRAAYPSIETGNIKVLDSGGGDLTYSPSPELQWQARALPFQKDLQSLADSLLGGPKRGLVVCRLLRSPDLRIHLQACLLMVKSEPQQQAEVVQALTQHLQERAKEFTNLLKTRNAWGAQANIYHYLGENDTRSLENRLRVDREKDLIVDEVAVREWTLRERTLSQAEIKMTLWGLTAPQPTPSQLAFGLLALAPSIFSWSLLLPWLVRRHRLGRSASPPL